MQKDLKILKRFNEQALVLSDEKFKVLQKFNISITANSEGFGRVGTNFPDEAIVALFLMKLRFFIIEKNNEFNFKKICNFFKINNYEVDKVSKYILFFESLLNRDVISIRVGEKTLSTKMIFNTILNEDNFHQESDQKGMQLIKSSPLIEPIARMKFLDVLGDIRIIICDFNKNIVEKYIQEFDKG